MELTTRRVTLVTPTGRVHVSDGQGTTASYPWTDSLTPEENHLSAAIDFARDLKGFTPAVVTKVTRRPSADGYVVTLSRYTTEEA